MNKAKNADRNSEKKEFRIEILVTVILCLLILFLNLPDRWFAAIYCTVPTFGGILSLFRKRWPLPRFWATIAVSLIVHLALVWWVFEFLLKSTRDVSFLPCVPFIFLEAAALYYGMKFLEPVLVSPSSGSRAK
jgi:apolipoprotein N-acyltransferase